MGRRRDKDDDDSSVLTINLGEELAGEHESYDSKKNKTKTRPPISDRKLSQLAAAREKSLVTRRTALVSKMERRLEELNGFLPGLRSEQINRVAHAMMERESALRAKQNTFTAQLTDELRKLRNEILAHRSSSSNASIVSSVAPSLR